MESNLKRSYLNYEEKNFYMMAKSFIETINGQRNLNNKATEEVWVEWEKRGMITKDMKKNLKMVKTYLNKFCDELELNLDKKEQEKLSKQLDKFNYYIIDDFTLNKIFRNMKDREKYLVVDKNKVYPVLAELMEVRCVGCKDDYRKCDLYNMFDDLIIDRVNECSNCPYACDLSSLDEEDKKVVEELKAKMKSKNKVGKGIVSDSDT